MILTLYGRILAVQPPRTVAHSDLARGDVLDLPGYMVTDVTVSAGGEALREGEDYDVVASIGALEFKRDVPGEVTISYRPGIEPRREVLTLDTQASYLAFGTVGLPWVEEPAVQIEATLEAPLQVRPVTLDDYVRHIQRFNPQAFYDAVGGAMGIDTQDIRRAEAPPQERTYAAAVRMLRGGHGGFHGGGGQAAA